MTTANTAASLLDQCRLTLGRMHRGMVPLRTVRADARERLIADGLAVEQTTGYLEVTARGRGLAANPADYLIEELEQAAKARRAEARLARAY